MGRHIKRYIEFVELARFNTNGVQPVVDHYIQVGVFVTFRRHFMEAVLKTTLSRLSNFFFSCNFSGIVGIRKFKKSVKDTHRCVSH